MTRAFCLPALLLTAPLCAQDLSAVLARMDAAGSSFRSVTAQLHRADYTAILSDTSTESGTIRMLRLKPGDLRFLTEFTQPDPKTVAFSGRKAEVYLPKMATVQEYDLSKYRNLIEQFLLLGFGSSSRELTRSYDIKLAGTDTIGGQPVSRLELVPRDAKARQQFNRIELWINADGYPLRQRFHEPSGNHKTATYSNLQVNQELTVDAVTLKLPKGVKREFPQK